MFEMHTWSADPFIYQGDFCRNNSIRVISLVGEALYLKEWKKKDWIQQQLICDWCLITLGIGL